MKKGLGVALVLLLLIAALLGYVIVSRQLDGVYTEKGFTYNLLYNDTAKEVVIDENRCASPRNIIFIYTGRWQFLRIQLAHIYRELHRNGGVIHEVWFMMINYNKETEQRLLRFAEVANNASKQTIFSFYYIGKPPVIYHRAYKQIFSGIVRHPYDKYFKLDDDIVYIHPGAFKTMIEKQNTSKCFMHFFNIAGSNWRCSWLHQKNNVYNETNPKNLVFDFSPSAPCGWKGADCAEMTLHAFLHHYNNNQLERYFFKELYLTPGRERFSINAFLFERNLLTYEMATVGPIGRDDEQWWTVTYSSKVEHPNCVVGEALVVHFAYRVVNNAMMKLRFLQEFEKNVANNRDSFKMEPEVWQTLGF